MKTFTPRPFLFVPCALLLCLALTACGDAPGELEGEGPARERGDGYAGVEETVHAPLEIPPSSPTVAFLGDSLTAGLHLSPDQAWPAALQRSLADRGLPFELQNAGSSGDTSAGGLTRTDWTLKSGPEIVVIGLGANDGLRGIDLGSTEANLRAIIEKVRAAGARPLLLGMNVPTNLGDYAEDFAAMYPRIAEDTGVPLVSAFLDGVGGVPDMNLPDGMHPTPEGHERLAMNVADALAELLRN
jgi:acyl-CoA thioesterase-1